MSSQHFNRLPAEWELQDGVQLTWPHADSDWAPQLGSIVALFEELVGLLAGRGQVVIGAPQRDIGRLARRFEVLGVPSERVQLYPVRADDTWVRDHGPITVMTEHGPCLYDYQFTGWGHKYPAALDNDITANLYRQGAYPGAGYRLRDLVLEGGAIDSDGCGTLLTTSQCLLNPNRNPGLNQAELEAALREDFGVAKINWLHHGALQGDDTDSHIDTLARLCPDQRIAYQSCDVPEDSHYQELRLMEDELRAMTSASGEPYGLIPLPWPTAKYDAERRRLPASYANFLVVNGLVIMPTYDDPRDSEALAQIAKAFPGYDVQGLDCSTAIIQHGSLHCLTMQLPQGVLRTSGHHTQGD